MSILKTESRNMDFTRGQLMKFRSQGKIPSVVFNGKAASIPVFVNRGEFERVFATHGKVFELEVDGKKKMVNAKEIQRDVLGNTFLHISFQELTKGEKTLVNVPVQTVGDSPGVKNGGVIAMLTETLSLSVLPSNVPHHVEVDISKLDIGDHILVKDIKLPKGAEFDQQVDLGSNVIICHPPQKATGEKKVESVVEKPVEAVNKKPVE